jgi:GNAT superfamily N-acetyltransferase
MVAQGAPPAFDPEGIEVLGESDVPGMTALALANQPGPWGAKPIFTAPFTAFATRQASSPWRGSACGRKRDSRRSAACTDPAFRGKRYAARLIGRVMAGFAARGDAAFLHSWADNAGAIALYEQLGFRQRARLVAMALRRAKGQLMSDPQDHLNLNEADAANELMRLARQINRARQKYHLDDAPEIEDAEYDALIRRNEALEEAFPHLKRADSPSDKVGFEVAASPLSKVTHDVRMMSLDNAFSDEELAEFVARVRRFLALPEDAPVPMTAEPKIDGLSCSLRYEKGVLVRAARAATVRWVRT